MGLHKLIVIIGHRLQKSVVMQIAAGQFSMQNRYFRKQLVAFEISESKRKKILKNSQKMFLNPSTLENTISERK